MWNPRSVEGDTKKIFFYPDWPFSLHLHSKFGVWEKSQNGCKRVLMSWNFIFWCFGEIFCENIFLCKMPLLHKMGTKWPKSDIFAQKNILPENEISAHKNPFAPILTFLPNSKLGMQVEWKWSVRIKKNFFCVALRRPRISHDQVNFYQDGKFNREKL